MLGEEENEGESERRSNNYHPATSRHSASAGVSINTHRKCFPRRPLWANQSMTPLVQSSVNVSYPSDNPAPSRLHCKRLALKPAHTPRAVYFYWVTGAKQGRVFFLGELFDFQRCFTLMAVLVEICTFGHHILFFFILHIELSIDFCLIHICLIKAAT